MKQVFGVFVKHLIPAPYLPSWFEFQHEASVWFIFEASEIKPASCFTSSFTGSGVTSLPTSRKRTAKEEDKKREESKRDPRVMWEAVWRRAVVSILKWHQKTPQQWKGPCTPLQQLRKKKNTAGVKRREEITAWTLEEGCSSTTQPVNSSPSLHHTLFTHSGTLRRCSTA